MHKQYTALDALAREIDALSPRERWEQLQLLRSAPPELRALARWRWRLLCRALLEARDE